MNKKEIIDKVKNAGVVGAGGAGFPTHVKLEAKVEYVIANGAECEPLLRIDQQLMASQANKVIKGLELVMGATGAKKGFIALKEKYKPALEALQARIKDPGSRIQLFILADFYPAGDEQILVYEVLKRIVPEGGIPLDVGVVVDNVGTLINITDAMEGRPVTHRYLTISGAVKEPKSVKVPVGMSVGEVIRLAEPLINDFSILDGGPMMGKLIEDLDSPVMKTTTGLIVLPKDHQVIMNKTLEMRKILRRTMLCMQCTDCTELCPRYLIGHSLKPHKIMRHVGYEMRKELNDITAAFLCSECGLCNLYACPFGLSPLRVNQEIKKELTEAKVKNPHKGVPEEAHPMIEYRRVPTERIISRIGVEEYNLDAPLEKREYRTNFVRIPLSQHVGERSIPIVKLNDKVKVGDLIADIPRGALGARIHASIEGKITDIGDCITIEA
ncbi:4Fe-4S dicluster domain-containing protein [bacterium]|nr:4Fe-4S dicluster domain-containing protein [bacterium]MCG2677918.1 4Fe-4S dicluster domain-containing protein [bacterium]